MEEKGQILVENIIFITLNLIFLTILVLFVLSRTGTAATIEEKYSKQIALMIDAAKPGMAIHLNMKDAFKEAEENGISPEDIVLIQENEVTVQLRENGGYSYSFFNNVDVSAEKSSNKNEFTISVNDYN